MNTHLTLADNNVTAQPADSPVAPDTRGMNYYAADASLRGLLPLYLDAETLDQLEPHLQRMGELAANRLEDLAMAADKHPPVLVQRTPRGEDRQAIDYHPAYREMERIAFGEFGLHAMSHRGGVLGRDTPWQATAKYALSYLFVQAEFGLLCPVSMTDTVHGLIAKNGPDNLRETYGGPMLRRDLSTLYQGAMFMTERHGGSDVGANQVVARHEAGEWRLFGDKWFCSNVDAEVTAVLARPEGAGPGTRGLGLFLLPRHLDDGRPNRYRIVRLKDKLGTRSMASGEVVLEGATAHVIGEIDRGILQMMETVNASRLSQSMRAAGVMRRCWHDALTVARHREAWGRPIAEFPLLRRQLLKILLPAEECLSFLLFTSQALDRAEAGDDAAAQLLRLATPLIKFRSNRDQRRITGDALEIRGGNGYIEDWANPRLVRDGHLGVLWEGTSNMVALDAMQRAIAKKGAHRVFQAALHERLDAATKVPAAVRDRLRGHVDRAVAYAERVAGQGEAGEAQARKASSALYHAASAALLCWEAAMLEDPRRLLLAGLVDRFKLSPQDPLSDDDAALEAAAAAALIDDAPTTLADAAALIAG